MCGFAVAVGWPEAAAAVRGMIPGIEHRGDITDPLLEPATGIAMCTRRLWIVDREGAVQPQASFDGKLLVSFNGEIYNHAALRQELAAVGVPFRTQSDTEVLANAIRVWGLGALSRLIGMFAFVAVEPDSGEFLAARDPFGVKPLYVAQDAERFLFCSEIRPLLLAAEKNDALLLPPGYFLSKKYCKRYRSALLPSPEKKTPVDPKTLDRLLLDAVAARVPPDLPAATMFSGGIDSTLIAHYARKIRADIPGYFVGDPSTPDYPYAAEYAEKTGYDLRILPLDSGAGGMPALLKRTVAVSESFEPSLIRSAVCSLLVAERIHADGYRVALCGEGADELFCGYAPHALAFAKSDAAGNLVRDDIIGEMHRVCLQRVDRCAMQYQLEARVPFLDPAVANYAAGLDGASMVTPGPDGGAVKASLRALYDLYPDELPVSIRDRKKILFSHGAGLTAAKDAAWDARFDDLVSDADLADGVKQFDGFGVETKEDLFYLRALAETMDVTRVPHLCGRMRISTPWLETA